MERIFNIALILAMLVMVTGCGKGGENTSAQLAAKVNGEEISVQQINSALARGGNMPPPEQAKKAVPQVLETMIDQQLLVQKALETKLDRETQVAQTLENARKQLLAQAYMEKILSSVAKPTAQEIRAFYDKNPMLFEQRRIYRFQELSVVVADEKFDAVNKYSRSAKTLTEIGNWLKTQNIPFKTIDSTKSAEELPMELLPDIAKMSDGQIAVLRGPGRVSILQLAQSQQAPLDVAHATSQIEQFLMNGKRLELAKAEVKKLRDAAKIEYVGDFDKTKPAAADKGQSAAK